MRFAGACGRGRLTFVAEAAGRILGFARMAWRVEGDLRTAELAGPNSDPHAQVGSVRRALMEACAAVARCAAVGD